MKHCVIFGAGFLGKNCYKKISTRYLIDCYSDNNSNLWGSEINNIPVIPPNELKTYVKNEDITVIVAVAKYYKEIVPQLQKIGFNNILVCLDGYMYTYEHEAVLVPCGDETLTYHKRVEGKCNILYVERIPGIRTSKIARLMREKGYHTSILYTEKPSDDFTDEYKKDYDNVYTCFTMTGLVDFIKNSEFDLIHCSNTPDILSAILVKCGIPIIHDCHDMESIRGKDDIYVRVMESIANIFSDGITCTSEEIKKITIQLYNRNSDDVLVLENIPMRAYPTETPLPKLSEKDGELHCVYEGGMVFEKSSDIRYFNEIWHKIADAGIHIHYYTQSDEKSARALEKESEYFHYEGNMSSLQLATEMTKYDCGLMYFANYEQNKLRVNTSSPNKMYEYLNAGLPIIAGGCKTFSEFVEKYNVGETLDINGDIAEQITRISKINIPLDFLTQNALTLESKASAIDAFYKKVLSSHK